MTIDLDALEADVNAIREHFHCSLRTYDALLATIRLARAGVEVRKRVAVGPFDEQPVDGQIAFFEAADQYDAALAPFLPEADR